MIEREVDVLNYLNEIDDDKRNYIIKMFGYEERDNGEDDHFMYIVLELGGKNLYRYYDEKIKEQGGIELPKRKEDILIKLIKGAALALEQFHKFGVHGDIKYENFVVSLNQNPELDFIEVKLIDFNLSIVGNLQTLSYTELFAQGLKAPEIKKTDNLTREADVWAFGLMVEDLLPRELSNDQMFLQTKHNTKLNRVINECFRKDPNERPKINEIYKFLNDEIDFLTEKDKESQLEIAELERNEKERIAKENSRFKNRIKKFFGRLIKTIT